MNNVYDDVDALLVYPAGTATAEDELIQLYRLHFGYGNRYSLGILDSVAPLYTQDGDYTTDFEAGSLISMGPKVCAVLELKRIHESQPHDLEAEVGDGQI